MHIPADARADQTLRRWPPHDSHPYYRIDNTIVQLFTHRTSGDISSSRPIRQPEQDDEEYSRRTKMKIPMMPTSTTQRTRQREPQGGSPTLSRFLSKMR
jgi:hypothetical protein